MTDRLPAHDAHERRAGSHCGCVRCEAWRKALAEFRKGQS